jgi:hypothetical protein
MHQPTKPNHSEAVGAAISHSQNINTPIDIAAEFDKMANEYAGLLIGELVRTDKSDAHLLKIITDFANQLYKENLSLITIKMGYGNYTANKPVYLPNLGNISLNYDSKTTQLRIAAIRGKNVLPFPVFNHSQIWNENEFMERFIYMGKHQKPNQSQNPVFNFFDRLLIDYVTE